MRTILRLSEPVALLIRLAFTAAIATQAVACGPKAPPPKSQESAEDRAEKAKFAEANKLYEQANESFRAKKFDEARDLLDKAAELEVESLSFQLAELREKVDKRHAKLWANEVEETFKEGDCKAAFGELANQMRELESDVFTRELRSLVASQALSCVQAKVDAATTAGNFAEARALVNAPDTKAVLGPSAQKKLANELDTTILEAFKAQLGEQIGSKKWADALAKVDEAQKKQDVSEEGGAALLAFVRDAMTPEIAGIAQRGVGQRDAQKALDEVDRLVKLGRWDEKQVPEAITKKRQALGVWIEAQRLKYKPPKKFEKRFAHGKVAVLPAAKSDAPSKRDLAASTEVWILGQTKDHALVMEADPTGLPLDVQLERAVGWVPVARLATKSTADWIPPDDQLVGTRVWAPLRAPETALELGVVSAFKGQDVTVKRLADDKEVVVKRPTLRLGRLIVGQKMMAFCQAKNQIVALEEVLPDQRTVKLICEGGLRKEEVLPSLRIRPEDLPPPK